MTRTQNITSATSAACRNLFPAAFCKQCYPGTYMSNITMQNN